MKILSRQDLRNRLKSNEIAPVYTLFGAEEYLRNLAAKTIAEFALKDAKLRDFNLSEISLNEVELKSAIASAEQLPMMDSRRVVLVTDVVVSGVKTRNNISEDDEDFLKSYLSNPSETTVVIFVADELDKRRKISKLFLNNSVAVEFKALQENELIYWAKEKVRELKADSDEKAMRHLVGLVGSDVRKLTNEVEKLAAAAISTNYIDFDLVDSLVPNTRDLDNFALTNQLLANNKSGALRVMKKILDDGAEPVMLLGLLSYNFHRLFVAKEMMEQGMSEREVDSTVRLPYNQRTEFLTSARRTKKETFSYILKRLARADQAIKTSVATPRLQIEILVCELVSL